MTELVLSPNWGFSQTNKPVSNRIKLGDGYSLDITVTDSEREEWSLSCNGLSDLEIETYILFIENHAGVIPFQWRPYNFMPLKNFWCSNFNTVEESPGLWKISLSIQEAR
jgi:phage-related protein